MLGVWQNAIELLQGGLGREQALETLQNVANGVASWFRLATTSRQMIQLAGPFEGASELLVELDDAENEIQRVKASFEKIQSLVPMETSMRVPGLRVENWEA